MSDVTRLLGAIDAGDPTAADQLLPLPHFNDCTTAPRNGLISGCYPLDKYYSARSEFAALKEIKKQTGA